MKFLLALLLAAFSLSPIASRLERATEKTRFAALAPGIPLLAFGDTVAQHVDIGGGGEQTTLWTSGELAASFPDPAEAGLLAAKGEAHAVTRVEARLERCERLGGGG